MSLCFELGEEQRMVRDGVRKMLSRFAPRRRELRQAMYRREFPTELWDAVADAQCELVEVSGLMARVEEAAGDLDELQKTSRILYLTQALEDQREATECLAQQSAVFKREAASLRTAKRLQEMVDLSE